NLKLRVSYGVAGNEAINPYQTLSLMDSNPLALGSLSNAALRYRVRMGNQDLRWEKTAGFNTGVDFGLWGNRLSGTAEFYKPTTHDMLILQRLARITGFADVWSSLGKVSNTGMDVTLKSISIVEDNFSWSSTLVFAHNKNEMVGV